MALFLTVLILGMLFTAGLTLWHRRKQWRPVGALLMLLPMAICGNVMFSVGMSYYVTETVALVHPDSLGSQESRGESVVETETLGEVDAQAVAFVVSMGVLFTLGLLVWGTIFLEWLRRRVKPRTPQVQ